MTTYECFDVSISDNIAHVQMNRPGKFNSMIPAFWRELPEIIDGISDDAAARAIVVSSTGKHFCSGMDLAVFGGGANLDSDGDGKAESGRRHSNTFAQVLHLQDTFNAFERARMPVLMAIQGGCIGGGVDMVTAADMRYATANAWFCIQEINIGMTADVGTLQRLPKLIPEGIVRELAYTGRRMSAERAREVGLVNEVYDTQEQMLDAVMATAAEIASKSPLAVWGTKETVNYTRDHSVADSLNYIAAWQAGMFQPKDMIVSFEAQMNKEQPVYDDLPRIAKGLG